MMSIIFIFVDGVGLGPEHSANPFHTTETPFFNKILGNHSFTAAAAGKDYGEAALVELDANLGVEGLPQSATGQTSLFTGVNAAKAINRHLNGFPTESLKKILAEKGMFRQLHRRGLRGTFANAYRPEFFSEIEKGLQRRFSCSTLITYYAGNHFRTLEDLMVGRAVYMDITHRYLQKMGFDIPLVTPGEAGRRLAQLAKDFDLTLYEHFLTDIAGHDGDETMAEEIIITLDEFLQSVVEHMDTEEELLLLTSDHGNLEDLSRKGHTRNPVPALVVGKKRAALLRSLEKRKDITGVLPALLEFLTGSASEDEVNLEKAE